MLGLMQRKQSLKHSLSFDFSCPLWHLGGVPMRLAIAPPVQRKRSEWLQIGGGPGLAAKFAIWAPADGNLA
jgi:hypothetical protein